MSDGLPAAALGAVATITMGQSPDSAAVNGADDGLPFLQGCAEFSARVPEPRFHCSSPLRVGKSGSTLISVRAPVGTTNRADQDYCIGRGLGAVLAKPGIADDVFLRHAIEANLQFLHRRSQGSTFLAIGSKDLAAMPVPAPSLAMQRRIAEILSTVDEAIEQTEALIAKHQQIKAGLMHDLFTRGLTPAGHLRPPRAQAPHLYKESPLGWVPREWAVTTLETVSVLVTSGSRGWAAYYSEDGPIFVRIGNLTRQHPNLDLDDLVHVHPPNSSEGQRTRLIEGDLLISITADLGIIGVVPPDFGEAYINQHIALVRLDDRLASSRWMGHFLGGPGAQAWIRRLDDPGAKAGLNLPTVRNLPLVVPPRYEQAETVTRLDAADSGIARERMVAKKLGLLKRGLMHDLLTGRVRVPVAETKEVAADG